MVGAAKLVLDNEHRVIRDVATDEVERIPAHGMFGRLEL